MVAALDNISDCVDVEGEEEEEEEVEARASAPTSKQVPPSNPHKAEIRSARALERNAERVFARDGWLRTKRTMARDGARSREVNGKNWVRKSEGR